MYMGVPTRLPVSVVCSLELILAMPKSMSLGTMAASPGVWGRAGSSARARKMFSGLMSRCTMPARWATSSAPMMGTMISIASAGKSRPPRTSRSRSVSPWSSSCTM